MTYKPNHAPHTAQNEPAIVTRDLCRTFQRRRETEVVAVAGIDLRVEPGEIFGFLGPNGAGKTTRLRMLTTLRPPSGGTATVAGRDRHRQPRARRRRRRGGG